MRRHNLVRVAEKACTLALLVFMVGGCGDVDNPGADESGSIFSVGDIVSWYLSKEWLHQVDIVMDLCDDAEVEPFSDHYAKVKLINEPLPNAREQTASTIFLTSYLLQYSPASANAQALPEIRQSKSAAIPPCDPAATTCDGTDVTVMMVPIQIKDLLRGFYDGTQLSYNVTYTFYGMNTFSEPVSAQGSVNFVALDYDFCD